MLAPRNPVYPWRSRIRRTVTAVRCPPADSPPIVRTSVPNSFFPFSTSQAAAFSHSTRRFDFPPRAAAVPYVATLGEHTEAVLAEIGYTPGEIAALVNPTTARSSA